MSECESFWTVWIRVPVNLEFVCPIASQLRICSAECETSYNLVNIVNIEFECRNMSQYKIYMLKCETT